MYSKEHKQWLSECRVGDKVSFTKKQILRKFFYVVKSIEEDSVLLDSIWFEKDNKGYAYE